MSYTDLSGIWTCEIPGQCAPMRLPGTLDESGIGFPDDPRRQWKAEEVRRIGFWREGDPIVTRLTRKYIFEGTAEISRTVEWNPPEGKRVFVEAERGRQLRLLVNGTEADPVRPGCLSAPYTFEVTGRMTGRDQLRFLSDNHYPGWPRDAIVYSSAASDETQTNWNGLLGYIRIRTEKPVFVSGLRVYPLEDFLRVIVETDAACPWEGILHIASDALAEAADRPVRVTPGRHEYRFDLPAGSGLKHWDLGEGNLYDLTVSAPGLDPRTVRFGFRSFRAEQGHFTLNGRRVFLRGEANCAVFPETGYCPMEKEAWKEILEKYRAYGVNCMRFHSHCPPEAAFAAADEAGMLMQPELSHWDPAHAFETEEARQYYRNELEQILRQLANHPSFVMLTFGNELQAGETGRAFMNELLRQAEETDATRLYANASNAFYGEKGADPRSGFYTSMQFPDADMRATCDGMTGWLNREAPNSCRDYSEAVKALRRETDQPVFSFEVGQYEVLPDFGEIDCFRGVTLPENLRHIQEKVREKGLESVWHRMTEATGESALLCYRAEAEAALRTEGYSGISLLGLQDFPGQGTALVGMMNTHLRPKPGDFARPERFAAFFRDVLPLVLLEKYTWTAGETLQAQVKIANYGKQDLCGCTEWTLEGEDFRTRGRLAECTAPAGSLTAAGGEIRAALNGIREASRLTLTVDFRGNRNEYPLWVYPDEPVNCPGAVYECRIFDAKAESVLQEGGIVYLAPDSTEEAIPRSIRGQFSPDFWSVCTFPHQAGGMGLLINEKHPLFRHFPTEFYGNWQWWPMAGRQAMILPERMDTIITEMDSCAFLRPMAMLFECRCGAGRMLVSSLGLHELQQYPEARALQRAVYRYLDSGAFNPRQQVSPDEIRSIFRADVS